MLSFQQQSPDALAHAVERWRATKSEPWLIAALSKAERADSSARALAAAAAAITSSSPAYEMAVYYRARLLTEQNQQQAARQLLDANLPRLEKGPLSSFNLLLAQRLAAAADFHQFLEYAPRTPIEYAYTGCDDCGTAPDIAEQSKPLPKRLDGDSAIIFNQRLPLSLLTEAATNQCCRPICAGTSPRRRGRARRFSATRTRGKQWKHRWPRPIPICAIT